MLGSNLLVNKLEDRFHHNPTAPCALLEKSAQKG